MEEMDQGGDALQQMQEYVVSCAAVGVEGGEVDKKKKTWRRGASSSDLRLIERATA
jgi:hypothetical protein